MNKKTIAKKTIVRRQTLHQKLNDLPQFTSLLPVTTCVMQTTRKQNM
ncbi:unnamed protein product, partial [Rotaria magnacalcarata]